MTDTANLGLPFIAGGQAQKHVTHNEALRILDAAIQLAVQDRTRPAPPASPAEGQRHIVAGAPTGAWAGRAKAIAIWQDGAWAFLTPKAGWRAWSVADAALCVFDGAAWRDLPATLDNAPRVGVNTTAASPNLLSVKSNAALLAAINAADGGSGDARLQISKEAAAKTASVVFSDAFSGRAEFGLIGSDAFKLKVSADGATFVDALSIDQATGNAALPKGLSLTGVIAPPQITASQNDYNPAGLAAASVMQISADAARSLSGLAGGTDGRVVGIVNVGAQPVALLDESAASAASNRFTLGAPVTIPAKQAAVLRYDGAAARWQTIARPGAAPGQYPGTTTSDDPAAGNIGEFVTLRAPNTSGVVTISNASPGVVSWSAVSGVAPGCVVRFTTTGALPAPLTANTNYYVCTTGFAANASFTVSTSVANALAGVPIATTSAGSGAHTAWASALGASGANVDVVGLSLSAGNWLVFWFPTFTFDASTTVTSLTGAFSTVSGTPTSNSSIQSFAAGTVPSGPFSFAGGPTVVKLAATTTVYLVSNASFGVANAYLSGRLTAVRVR